MNTKRQKDLHENHNVLLKKLFEEVRNSSSIVYEGNFDFINPQEQMDEIQKINSIQQPAKLDHLLLKTEDTLGRKAKKSGKRPRQVVQIIDLEENDEIQDQQNMYLNKKQLKKENFRIMKGFEDSVDKKIIFIIKYEDGSLDSLTNKEMQAWAPLKLIEYYQKKISFKADLN